MLKKVIGWIIIILFIISLIGILVWSLGVASTIFTLIISISLSSLLVMAIDWVTDSGTSRVIIWEKVDK